MIVQGGLLLKKVTSLSAILIMLVSLVSISSMGSQAAYGQTNISTCEKLPVRQVGANGERGTATAALAIDNDPDTRWANQAMGSFIQLDLGKSQVICDIDIAWYRGNVRSYNFVISTSEDGTNFKDIASAASTGKTTSLERYNIPDQSARYLRVTVHGNTQNDLGSITEMAIRGHTETQEPPQQQNCTIPHINGVSAKGNDGHLPQNTLDNNANTRWSNFGFPSWIQYDLGTSQQICDVDIAWYRGNLRVNSFTISASEDGQTFQTIFSGKSSGKTTALEKYDVTDVTAKYLKITVTANTENNNWASITEVGINAGFPPGPTPNPTNYKIPTITAVGATGNDGHLPQNTLDNNANTRWSNLGLPSSIQYDLSTSQPICEVDIAWYRGNLRVNSFTISASQDGQNFIPIFIGKSTGKTTSPEKYDVQDTDARYVRITVLENNENNWASITGIGINGGSQTPVPTPEEICGNGVDDDNDGQIDEGCTPGGGNGGSQMDPFGIQKIYPTKESGEEWFMDMTDGQDPRSRPPSLTKNPDGSFKVTSSQVRYGVFTSSGYQPDEVELDHGILAQRGYMQSPNDWKNVELTGYVKVNSGQSGENFAWYARGGRHTGSGSPEGCEGSAYKPDLFYDGRVRFAKEQWHVSYVFTDHKRPMASIEDRWVGFKGIRWNFVENGKTVVKMEIWVDNNEDGQQNGPWVKVDENIDRGGWGSSGRECGGAPDQIITWGGPIATF